MKPRQVAGALGNLRQSVSADANHRQRLTHGARSLLRQRRDRYAGLEIRLKASKLANAQAQRQRIARERERTERLMERARRALATVLQRLEARVGHSGQLLGALSYRGVLARGFALVRDEHGHAVHAAASIGPGAPLSVEFADGRVAVTADTDRPTPTRVAKPAASEPRAPTREASKAAAPKRISKPVDQGSLF